MKKRIIALLILSLMLTLLPTKANASEITRIWIGDSRTVGLEQINTNPVDKFIAKGGMSYSWFNKEAIPELRNIINENSIVFINMGVNDCANEAVGGGTSNVEKYIETINNLIKEYPKTRFIYISVNPVDGDYPSDYSETGYIDKDKLNDSINKFNRNIKENCNIEFIDTNTFLKQEGFSTIDGIHYNTETTETIYNYCLKEIYKIEILTNNNKKEEEIKDKDKEKQLKKLQFIKERKIFVRFKKI